MDIRIYITCNMISWTLFPYVQLELGLPMNLLAGVVALLKDLILYCSTFQTLFGKFLSGVSRTEATQTSNSSLPFSLASVCECFGCKGEVHVSFNNTFGMSEQ